MQPTGNYFAAKVTGRFNLDNAVRPPRVYGKIFLSAVERIFPSSFVRLSLAVLRGRKIIPAVASRQNRGRNKTANNVEHLKIIMMKEEIRQDGRTILSSEDGFSIRMFFNNLNGKNFSGKEYRDYIRNIAFGEMGFRPGTIELYCEGEKVRTGTLPEL